MPEYRWKGKDLNDLTREEAIQALQQALDRVFELQARPVGYQEYTRQMMARQKAWFFPDHGTDTEPNTREQNRISGTD